MKAWKMEAAEAVVEFAKSQGFQHASWVLWDENGDQHDSADFAVADLKNGQEAGFQINVVLGNVRLRQEVIVVEDVNYSNGVEVPSERTLP